MDAAVSRQPALASRKLWLTGFVFTAIILNYVDRQMLALLKPTISAELNMSDRDYGHLISAFQTAAAFAFLGTGWFLDHVGLKRGFAASVGGWSLAAIGHALVSGLGPFIGVRVALGAFEAAGTPAAVKTAAIYFNARERSLVIGLGNVAPNVGAIIAPLTIPLIAVAIGWRAAFAAAGALGLIWVIVWAAFRFPTPERAVVNEPQHLPAWVTLLGERRQWALVLAKALTDGVWFFMLAFLPDFFHRAFGLGQGAIGAPVALVYLLAGAGALSGGIFSERLIARGMAPVAARQRSMLAYALLVTPVPAVLIAGNVWVAALLLGLALFAHQGFSTNVFTLSTDLFAPARVGSAIGIAAFAGNMAGAAIGEITGWSLSHGHGYTPLFLFAACTYLAAAGAVRLLAR